MSQAPDNMPALFRVTPCKVAVAAIAVAVVYLAGVIGRWWPNQDSAVYLGLAKSIVAGEGYRFNGQLNTQFSPGLPLILAGLMRAFGDSYWVLNLFIALCGLGAIAATWLSMRLLVRDAQLAFAATICAAFSYPSFVSAHRILTDTPFAFAFWVVVYAALRFEKGRSWWLLVASAIALAGIVIRAPGVLLLAPVALGIAIEGGGTRARRLRAAGALAAIAGGACVVLYTLARVASAAQPKYVQLLKATTGADLSAYPGRAAVTLSSFTGAISELFTSQARWAFAGAIVIMFGAAGIVRLWRRGERFVPTVAVLYPMLLAAALASYGMRSRYLFVIMPLIAYAYLAGVEWAFDASLARRGVAWAPLAFRWAVLVISTFTIAANAPRTLRDAFYFSALSRTASFERAVLSTMRADVLGACDVVSKYCPPGSIVGAPPDEATIIHYVTSRLTVPLLEDTRRSRRHDADNLFNLVQARRDIAYVLVDGSIGDEQLVASIVAELDADTALKAVYRGKGVLYERVK
jgi:hypothetical protein